MLGNVSALITLPSTLLQAATVLTDFADTLKHAPDDITELLEKVEALKPLASDIHDGYQNDQLTAQDKKQLVTNCRAYGKRLGRLFEDCEIPP